MVYKDKIYIIPGSAEILKYGLDNENKSIRGFECDEKTKDDISINLERKMNRNTKNLCINEESNNLPICTYSNSLQYIKGKIYDCSSQQYWNQFVNFINTFDTAEKRNFYLVTHHNRLKETILLDLLDSNITKHFSNCCCIRIYYKDNKWTFEIVYKGEPDKLEYQYFDEGVWDSTTEGIINLDNNLIIDELNNIKNKNINIFLIRHGNSCHNQPLKLTSSSFTAFINRISDSPLTPLGIYQIYKLKNNLIEKGLLEASSGNNINIYCASYLNRSQHSVLQLIPDINKYDKLSKLSIFFGKQAIKRLLKRVSKEEAITKLNEFNIKLNNKDIKENLEQIFNDFISEKCLKLRMLRKYKIFY